jgi:hypothetical protein
VNATIEEGTMSEPNDEERALLDTYADRTSPSREQVEHALTRMMVRIESSKRPATLPDARRRFVWIAAAGLATLVFATAAFAGVRWLRARSQPVEPSYGANWVDRVETKGDAHVPNPHRSDLAPDLAPAPPELVPEILEMPTVVDIDVDVGLDRSDATPRRHLEPKPLKREAADAEPADAETADAEPADAEPAEAEPVEASVLAEESRLLAHVRRALHDDDFESALEWAEEHARRHPHGLLTEERLVLEAVAACRGGQRERGLAVAAQLREQYPNTPTLAKVEQSCQHE